MNLKNIDTKVDQAFANTHLKPKFYVQNSLRNKNLGYWKYSNLSIIKCMYINTC